MSPRDHSFYTYYETKRTRHHEEEKQSVIDWLNGLKTRHSDSGKTKTDPIHAEYRQVMGKVPLVPGGHGARRLADDHPRVLTDRLGLRAPADVEVKISGTVKCKLIASASLSGGVETEIPLQIPTRSDRIIIETRPSGAPLEMLGLHGVTLSEIPTVDGYHPFLGDELSERN